MSLQYSSGCYRRWLTKVLKSPISDICGETEGEKILSSGFHSSREMEVRDKQGTEICSRCQEHVAMWQPDKLVHTCTELNNIDRAIAALWLHGSNFCHLVGQNSAGIGVSSTERDDDIATAVLSSKICNDTQVLWLSGLIPNSNFPIIRGRDRLAPAKSNFS